MDKEKVWKVVNLIGLGTIVAAILSAVIFISSSISRLDNEMTNLKNTNDELKQTLKSTVKDMDNTIKNINRISERLNSNIIPTLNSLKKKDQVEIKDILISACEKDSIKLTIDELAKLKFNANTPLRFMKKDEFNSDFDNTALREIYPSFWKHQPVGTFCLFTGNNSDIPDGWFLCDGRAIDRKKYSELYKVIGGTWGKDDKKNTFNLPNLEGLFLKGKSIKSGNFNHNIGNYQDSLMIASYVHLHNSKISNHLCPDYTRDDPYYHLYESNETRPKNAHCSYIIKYK